MRDHRSPLDALLALALAIAVLASRGPRQPVGWLLLGLGLYFSVRLKTTTAAVATTLGIYFGLKLFCCGGLGPLFLLSSRAMGPGGPSGVMGGLMPLLMSLGPTIIHMGAGLLFFRLATRRLRRDAFA